ncbi:MAG: hypothetical protein JSS69_10150 [Acidobacteria bacterium]|nr:hypothetical protein [Acidobacteriota bacterium]MBS1866265.1 hypothetical protein [Acidobacteriota bacterium]
MRQTTCAVLIADVVGSRVRKNLRHSLAHTLARASRKHLQEKLVLLPYAVTAGDEFQTIAFRPSAIPRILLDLRALFHPLSLRVGIGIGGVPGSIRPPVNRLTGEAFQSARTAIDRVKGGNLFKFETLTAVTSPDPAFDEAVNLLYGLNDTLVRKVTPKQWETIRAILQYPALERSARHLRLDISTVSRNLKRGYYWQQSETVKVAEKLFSRAFC